MKQKQLIEEFKAIVGEENVLTDEVKTKYYRSGFVRVVVMRLLSCFLTLFWNNGRLLNSVLKQTASLSCRRLKQV